MRLVDVAKATRVGVHHLAALEHEDFSALPNDVFVKGFVRVYAECLELDPDKLVAEYLAASAGRRPESSSGNGDGDVIREMSRILRDREVPSRFSPKLFVGAAGAIALLAVVAWLWFGRGGDDLPGSTADLPQEAARSVEVAAPASVDGEIEAPRREEDAQTVTPARSETKIAAADPVVTKPPVKAMAPAKAATAEFTIPESAVGTGIENRQLVGESDRFAPGAQLYFWNRVVGAEPGTTIHHVWFHDGVRLGSTSLKIGGSHWRTQSRQTLWKPGSWAVEAHDDAGNVLARAEFDCIEPD